MAERVSDDELVEITRYRMITPKTRAMAAELLAYRQKVRALVEAWDEYVSSRQYGGMALLDRSGIATAERNIRALVKGE